MSTHVRIDMQPYVESLVLPTVRDVSSRWGEYVDMDDLMQEAALWWYLPNTQKYLPTYLEEDAAYVRLRRSIWRYVARYAEKEKGEKVGYHWTDQLNYRPTEIVALLPLALDPDGVPEAGVADLSGVRVHGNLAEGGTTLAALIDIRRALHALEEDDRQFLQVVSDTHADWDEVARAYEVQAKSARQRHTRITERMARWLNNDQHAA